MFRHHLKNGKEELEVVDYPGILRAIFLFENFLDEIKALRVQGPSSRLTETSNLKIERRPN